MLLSLSTNFAMAPTNDVANDFANDLVMTRLVSRAVSVREMMSLECNPFGTRRNVDRFHSVVFFEEVCQEGLHNRCRGHHCRWLRVALEYMLVNLAVHGCKVCIQSAPTLQPSRSSLHVFEVLLCDAPEENGKLRHWDFTEPRAFARACHGSVEFSISTPRVHGP